MSGGQGGRLSSESEYYGYLEYSEEQYSDYYRANMVKNSLEHHEENGGCVINQVAHLKILQYFK